MIDQIENTQGKTENTMTNQDQNTQEITKDNDGLPPTRQPNFTAHRPTFERLNPNEER